MRIAMYNGSFDPLTKGHLEIIRLAKEQFDRIVIVVASNPAKKCMFTPEERVAMIRAALGHVACYVAPGEGIAEFTNPNGPPFIVTTLPPGALAANFAIGIGAKALVRGLRAATDFDDEFQLNMVNHLLAPAIGTVFFFTSHEYIFTSSSIAKAVAGVRGELSHFVTPNVVKALQDKMGY